MNSVSLIKRNNSKQLNILTVEDFQGKKDAEKNVPGNKSLDPYTWQ